MCVYFGKKIFRWNFLIIIFLDDLRTDIVCEIVGFNCGLFEAYLSVFFSHAMTFELKMSAIPIIAFAFSMSLSEHSKCVFSIFS